ncbi:MAG: DUF2279 domain-containing protein [Bacteroidia bacterium]|nr:DUF2279 domain-containing protein [Bacteroidia bacterium]
MSNSTQRTTCFFLAFILAFFSLSAQDSAGVRAFHFQHDFRKADSFFQNELSLNPRRKRLVSVMGLGVYAGSMLYLGSAWYSQEDLSRFHFFNDMHEWKQIDKAGHTLGGYHSSRMMIGMYKWSGMEKNKAILYGSLSGFLAMSSIEVFDGFGETWGFSWPDIGANFLGASLAAGNQWLWNEDRIQLKVSYVPSVYAGNPDFEHLFGSNPAEWILKDYNGHTMWLSVRVHSFLPESTFRDRYPRWLNLAVGYGAEGLEGGYDDPSKAWLEREYRQLYLSLDIDVSQIRTRSGFLNTLFSVVNIVRIPLPAVQFDKTGVGFRAFQ